MFDNSLLSLGPGVSPGVTVFIHLQILGKVDIVVFFNEVLHNPPGPERLRSTSDSPPPHSEATGSSKMSNLMKWSES